VKATSSLPVNLSVAIVSRYPPFGQTHVGRGIAAYTRNLAEHLAASGVTTHVLAEQSGSDEEHYVDNSVLVHRVWRHGSDVSGSIINSLEGIGASLVHLQYELFMFGAGLKGARQVPTLLRNIRRMSGLPVATTMHGVLPRGPLDRDFTSAYVTGVPSWAIRRVYDSVTKSVVQQSDLVIAHGWSILASVHAYARPSLSLVIPHGIESPMTLPDRGAALRRFGLADVPRAVFFGYRLPYKGIETLEAAAPLLSDHGIEVLVAGGSADDADPTGSSRHRMTQGNATRQLGFIEEGDIPNLFAVADVLVLPYRVGMATSGPLASAASYGTPVVISDVPSLAEMLDFSPATFPVGDSQALAETVLRVLKDDDVRAGLRARLAALALESSWASVVDRSVNAYLKVVRVLQEREIV
jgi:glycosyltransferase involved in cell wall biosynthesis